MTQAGIFDTLRQYSFLHFMRILVIVQVAVSLLLIVSILLQSRGSGMSVSLGGGNYYAKRGFEKFLLVASTVLGVLFILLSGVNAWLSVQ